MKNIYRKIWRLALPLQDKRNDSGHAKVVLDGAFKLCRFYRADENVIIPAAILHDIGWSKVPKKDIRDFFDLKRGPARRKKIKRRHEKTGIKMARIILEKINYPLDDAGEILKIISRHDTGQGFSSENEGLVRDADKLWRFSKKGFWLDVRRFQQTPLARLQYLKRESSAKDYFYSRHAKKLAAAELKKRKKEFKP